MKVSQLIICEESFYMEITEYIIALKLVSLIYEKTNFISISPVVFAPRTQTYATEYDRNPVHVVIQCILSLLVALESAKLNSPVLAARTFAHIADVLACMAGKKGGLRSGPAANVNWKKAFQYFEVKWCIFKSMS
jgi:hypothetical protein